VKKNPTPAPKFMHVALVKFDQRKTPEGIIVMEEKPGCVLASVISNSCTKEGLSQIQPGQIVFVRPDNFNFIIADNGGTHGIVYEDAIMAYCDPEDFEAKIIGSLDCVKEYGKNEIVEVNASGATIGKRAKPTYN
jgi:hypothetical protein